MKKIEDLVDIAFVFSGGDCTSQYYIETKRQFTVKEFINAVISDEHEWGYISVNDEQCIEYRHGSIISGSIDENVLNREVVSLSGSGGWSRSDYQLTVL